MDGACAELSRWTYAGGKQLPGLVRRRAAERQLCEGLGMTGRGKTILAALALAGAFAAGWTAQGWRADAAAARVQAEQSGKDVAQAQQSQAATENKAGRCCSMPAINRTTPMTTRKKWRRAGSWPRC
jgi:hypothetical protein